MAGRPHHQHRKKDRSIMRQNRQGQRGRQTKRGRKARTKRKAYQGAGENGRSHRPPPTTNTERQRTHSMKAHSPNGRKAPPPTTNTDRKTEAQGGKTGKTKEEGRPEWTMTQATTHHQHQHRRQRAHSKEAHSPTTHHQHRQKDRSTRKQDRQDQRGRQTRLEEDLDELLKVWTVSSW